MKVKGNGSVRPVKNKKGEAVKNSWQLVVSMGSDPITGKRIQKTRHFRGNKTAANRALSQFITEIEQGLKIDADKITFGEYARKWQEAREVSGRLMPATVNRDKGLLKHLLKYLDRVILGDIDTVTVRNLYITLSKDGMSQDTCAKIAVLLKQILKQAVNDDIILRNPCDRVEAPKRQKTKKGRALEDNDVPRLVAALIDEASKTYPHAKLPQQKHTTDVSHVTAVLLSLASGLRQGEILGASWGDLDFANRVLHVRNSFDKVTHKLKVPKTPSSIRDVVLDSETLQWLKDWKALQARYLLSLGISQDDKTAIITNECGARVDGNNLGRWWRSFRKRNGFEDLRFHDLRHTHATMLARSGLNFKAVSTRMGHANIAITLDLYAHAQRDDDEEAARIVSNVMNQPLSEAKIISL